MRLTEAYWNWLQFAEAHCKVFLGDLRNEFSMIKKSNFYSVFNNIFHSKCKTVYTFEALFRLPSSTGYPKNSITVMEPWRIIQFGPLSKSESRRTMPHEKIRWTMPGILVTKRCHFRPRKPIFLTPASLQDDGSMHKANSLQLLYYSIILSLYYNINIL